MLAAPERGSADELLDAGAHSELDAMRHSTAHVMAEAVMDLFPGTKLGIGPAIHGRLLLRLPAAARRSRPTTSRPSRQRMAESVAADHPFVRRELPPDEGRAFFVEREPAVQGGDPGRPAHARADVRRADAAGQRLRARPVRRPVQGSARRVHGEDRAVQAARVAGAYWRGDEKRPMLQRVYGTVWPTQEELDQFLWRREEARKRDHRRLGVALDLFSFHDVSPGSAFWHPKGQRIWRTLEGAMRELQERRGYLEVSTPILVHKKLWEQSGHWDHYADNMFKVEAEGQTFSLKPMNCPESTFIYRVAAALVPRPAAATQRIRAAASERAVGHALGSHARTPVHPGRRAHLRPPRPAARRDRGAAGRGARVATAGSAWSRGSRSRRGPTRRSAIPRSGNRAEALIKEALDAAEPGNYVVKPKDGTFYAPKIDIYIDDALGREWQMATIQVDLVMLPERFDLSYIDEHGAARQRPMAIHRAIYGSLERFIGILVEHFAGRVPVVGARRSRPSSCPSPTGTWTRREELAGVLRVARPARRGGRLRQPDAEQDPRRPGAEGPVHAGARRPRGRGPHGVAADPCRRAAAGRALGGSRGSPGRRRPATGASERPARRPRVGTGSAGVIGSRSNALIATRRPTGSGGTVTR